MIAESSLSPPILPALLRGDEILLPLKVDVTIAGARVVDTFCWRLYNSYITPDEFSWRLCSDQNLPLCFQPAIALQIYEQLTAFQEMLASIRLLCAQGIRPPWKSLMHMNIGIRHCTLDYSDKFQWDVLADTGITPEVVFVSLSMTPLLIVSVFSLTTLNGWFIDHITHLANTVNNPNSNLNVFSYSFYHHPVSLDIRTHYLCRFRPTHRYV